MNTENMQTAKDSMKDYIKNKNKQTLLNQLDWCEKQISIGDSKFTNGNICGKYIATLKDGNLAYIIDKQILRFQVDETEEKRQQLKDYYNTVVKVLNEKVEKSCVETQKIMKSLQRVTNWCVENGFYGKALDFSKLLHKYYEMNGDAVLEKVVKGYAKRQLTRGVDCFNKVKYAIKDAQLGKYGAVAKANGKNYYYDMFSKTTIKVPFKKMFGISYKVIGMQDYYGLTKLPITEMLPQKSKQQNNAKQEKIVVSGDTKQTLNKNANIM